MNAATVVARARDLYIEQFEAFVGRLQQKFARCASELKLRLGEDSKLFQRLFCVDFIADDGRSRLMELKPDRILSFPTIFETVGAATLCIGGLSWDDVTIRHDLAGPPVDALNVWFRHWFDPDDERRDANARLSMTIHSLLCEPAWLSVDFGTAPTDAFWDLMKLLEAAGARRIRVEGSGH